MDDVASAHSESLNLRKIQQKLLQWEKKECSLTQLTQYQIDALDQLSEYQQHKSDTSPANVASSSTKFHGRKPNGNCHWCIMFVNSQLQNSERNESTASETDPTKAFHLDIPTKAIDSTQDFFNWYSDIETQLYNGTDDIHRQYYDQLASRRSECDHLLDKINSALDSLDSLKTEYNFVSNKTWSLNSGSEKLIAEQNKLIEITDEIKRRLHYFTQAENLLQILQSPTISVASEMFEQTLTKVDECIAYIKSNVSERWWTASPISSKTIWANAIQSLFQSKFKDSATYLAKHNQCLAKAVVMIKNYLNSMFTNTAEQISNMKSGPKDG